MHKLTHPLQNCLTSNVIDCILMNGKNLLLLYVWLSREPSVRAVFPISLPLFSSQSCEQLFRDIRTRYASVTFPSDL